MNWGASYLVNDFYKRFVRRDAEGRHLTRVSRLTSLLILAIGSGAAYLMRDISVDEAWKLLAALGAGTGAVFMLRWFWWRINAWSEIVAMVASLAFFIVVSRFVESNEYRLAIVAGLTIAAWLAAGWRPLARRAPEVEPDRHIPLLLLAAVLAAGIVYLTLPGVGLLIFGNYTGAVLCLLGAAVCAVGVALMMRRVGWGQD